MSVVRFQLVIHIGVSVLMIQLVMHLGMSGFSSELKLEQQARNNGYTHADIKGLCPDNWCVKVGTFATKSSRIDMDRVRLAVNNSACDINAVVSQDSGR